MNSRIKNKKAFYDYEILDTLEAGIVLTGAEVKSIRNGRISLQEGYVYIDDDLNLWLYNAIISKYEFAPAEEYEPGRPRRLLVSKKEALWLKNKARSYKGTVIPLQVYPKGKRIKVEIGLARGKKKYDKKLREKERDLARETHEVRRQYNA